MSHQTLQSQQQGRKQSKEGGNAKGVIGKLDQPPVKRFEDFDPESFDKEHFIVQLQRAGEQFQQSFPQVSTDVYTQAGQHNLKVNSGWLKAHGVAGQTMNNLRQCVEDAFADLIFVPSAIGLSAEPATGADLIRELTSEQWQRLVGTSNATITAPKDAPKTFAEAKGASTDDRALSADEFRKRHPESWADQRAIVAAEDEAYVAREVDKFLRAYPMYLPSDANKNLINQRIKSVGGRITQSTIAAAFNQLVAEGKIETNGNVEHRSSGLTHIDYGAAKLPVQQGQRETPGQTRNAPMPEAKEVSAAELARFKSRMHSMPSSEFMSPANKRFRDAIDKGR